MTCHRYEREAPGDAIPDGLARHIATCTDCQAERARFEKLGGLIRAARARIEVPAELRERLLARVGEKPASRPAASPRPARPWRQGAAWGWAAALTAAAAVALWLKVRPSGPTSPGLGLAEIGLTSKVSPRAAMRGDGVNRGDLWLLHGQSTNGLARQLRVYRDDLNLVARCPGDPAPACTESSSGIDLSMVLTPGRYQAIWLVSASAPIPPARSLDGDAGAAGSAGLSYQLSDELRVR